MKKLLVLAMVVAMGSLASGGLIFDDGLVRWNVEAGQLLGMGVANGVYDAFMSADGAIVLSPDTDSGMDGVMLAAGSLSRVDNFGPVWNVHAEHLAIAGGHQTPGTWFVFDIVGVGDLVFYDAEGNVRWRTWPELDPEPAEPASLVLLGFGVIALRCHKRRIQV